MIGEQGGDSCGKSGTDETPQAHKRFSSCRPFFVPSLFLISRYRDFSFYPVILVPNKMER
ncbi:hypothetical protein GFV16_17700 [Bacillus megaterium]|nr:hypothetical protein [Priestia megaterium]